VPLPGFSVWAIAKQFLLDLALDPLLDAIVVLLFFLLWFAKTKAKQAKMVRGGRQGQERGRGRKGAADVELGRSAKRYTAGKSKR